MVSSLLSTISKVAKSSSPKKILDSQNFFNSIGLPDPQRSLKASDPFPSYIIGFTSDEAYNPIYAQSPSPINIPPGINNPIQPINPPSQPEELSDFEKKIQEYLDKIKETPWFYPTPWQGYPKPPKIGETSSWNVDFMAALTNPEAYLEGLTSQTTKVTLSGTDLAKKWFELRRELEKMLNPSGLISTDPFSITMSSLLELTNFPEGIKIDASSPQAEAFKQLVQQYGFELKTIKGDDGKTYLTYTFPSQLVQMQDAQWKENLRKAKNLGLSVTDSTERIVLGHPGMAGVEDQVKKLQAAGLPVEMVGGVYVVLLKPRLKDLTLETTTTSPGGVPSSSTSYSTWVPPFPDLGINPQTGLPYTQEEFNKLPDYQKVAIWMSQLLQPTGMISAAYQQTLAQALAGQRATINQLQEVISKYGGRFDEAWSVGQQATKMLEEAGKKVTSLLGEAENVIKTAGSMYLQAQNEMKPIYQNLLRAANDVYNQAQALAQGITISSQEATNALWQQYQDIYNTIASAYQNVLTGQVAPATAQWLELLAQTQSQAVEEALNRYYEEKQRELVDTLAGRGILSSRTAASTLSDLGEAIAEQLRQAQYQIMADYAKRMYETPFKQYEAALGLLQAPQVGASLLEASRRSLSTAIEPLTLALQAIAQGRSTASDLASTLLNTIQGYQSTGTQLASMAPQYFLPGQNLLTAARTLSAMAAEGLGSQTAALQAQYGMWSELPENLRKAFSTYGGMASNFLQSLIELYLGKENINLAKRRQRSQELAGIINAIASIFS